MAGRALGATGGRRADAERLQVMLVEGFKAAIAAQERGRAQTEGRACDLELQQHAVLPSSLFVCASRLCGAHTSPLELERQNTSLARGTRIELLFANNKGGALPMRRRVCGPARALLDLSLSLLIDLSPSLLLLTKNTHENLKCMVALRARASATPIGAAVAATAAKRNPKAHDEFKARTRARQKLHC
jgi:hypothetical protein